MTDNTDTNTALDPKQQAKAELQTLLDNLQAGLAENDKAYAKVINDIESATQDLVDKIAQGTADPIRLHNRIDELQRKKSRLEAAGKELRDQIPAVKQAIYNAEQAEFQAHIAEISAPATQILDEIVLTIEKLYYLVCDYSAAELAVNIAWPQMDNWRGLHTKVVPIFDIKNRCDIWLGKPGFGASYGRDYIAGLGVKDWGKRKQYFSRLMDETRENTRTALDEKTLEAHRQKMYELSLTSLGIDPSELKREPEIQKSTLIPTPIMGESIQSLKKIVLKDDYA